MGDADDSYNFLELDQFIEKLREGYDIVIGNRFGKKIEKGAMKPLHRFIGTPMLSHIIRKKFKLNIKDINCGLRGGKTTKLRELECKSTGMEFASEMIIKASRKGQKIAEVPINFYKDKREERSHLRTIRDGLRHLSIIVKEKGTNNKLCSNYFSIYIITCISCITLLVLAAILPNEQVKENCKKALESYKPLNNIYPEIIKRRKNTALDNYADSVALSIIYSLEKDRPLSSALEAKYHNDTETLMTNNFRELLNGEAEPETDYVRYWHGYIVILKPLLMIFQIEQIEYLNLLIIAILFICLNIQLWKIDKSAVIALILGSLSITLFVVPFCFEYTWNFIIAFLISNICLKIDNGDNKKIYHILFFTGLITCFFDFLTTELLTVLLPLLCIIIKRKKENSLQNSKQIYAFIIKSILIWLIAYGVMYLTKWILASIVLKEDFITSAIKKAGERMSNTVNTTKINWLDAIENNISILYPIILVKQKYIFYILIPISIIIMLMINKYRRKDNSYLYYILILGIIPYVRYIALQNHSWCHYFFTFRSQLISVMSYLLILFYTLKRKRLV